MKTALVTGSSRGIGKAICQTLLEQNYKVYGLSTSKSEFHDDNFVWLQCDLGDEQQIEKSIGLVAEAHIDVLVNNAGIAFKLTSRELDAKNFDDMYGINFLAPIHLAQALGAKLTGSLIMNISSDAAKLPFDGYALYGSSKAALDMYFKVFALENPQTKVVSLMPGMVDTPMLRKIYGNSFDNWNDILQPQDIADLVQALIDESSHVSSGAGVFVTNTWQNSDLTSWDQNLWIYDASLKKLTQLV